MHKKIAIRIIEKVEVALYWCFVSQAIRPPQKTAAQIIIKDKTKYSILSLRLSNVLISSRDLFDTTKAMFALSLIIKSYYEPQTSKSIKNLKSVDTLIAANSNFNC
jgi:hypothetical protein